jgi:putative flippase GtrA
MAELLRIVKFGSVGLMNTAVDYGVWFILYYLIKLPLLICQTAGYLTGTANSYIMNSVWTFGTERLWDRNRIFKFVVVNAASYLSSLAVIWLFALFLPAWLAKGFTVGATFAINFLGSRLWVFRRTQ